MSGVPTYRAAVVGLGRIGLQLPSEATGWARTHVAGVQRCPRTELVAGCDVNADQQAMLRRAIPDVPAYSCIERMLDQTRPDIMCIATPPDSHARLCRAALQAGVRAVLCEKPFVEEIADGEDVIALAQARNAAIVVNHWMRWSPLYCAADQLVCSSEFGPLRLVRGHYCKGLHNSGSHLFDTVRMFAGDVDTVRASERVEIGSDQFNIGGILNAGAVPVHITVGDYREHFTFEIDLWGAHGRVTLLDEKVTLYAVGRHDAGVNRLVPKPDVLHKEVGGYFEAALNELAEFLDTGRTPRGATAVDGLAAVGIANALEESWSTGQAQIDVPSVGSGHGVLTMPEEEGSRLGFHG
jgi:predicted dehydrogenase